MIAIAARSEDLDCHGILRNTVQQSDVTKPYVSKSSMTESVGLVNRYIVKLDAIIVQ